MNTDSFFEIGSTHEVCQDYATSGQINEHLHFAIIADGCSQSHKVCGQAALGAQVIAYAAQEAISDIYRSADKVYQEEDDLKSATALIKDKVLTSILAVGKLLKLSRLYSDCTLLIAVSDGEKTNCFIYGDGGVAATFDGGSKILYRNISFLSGAPYYLSYSLDQERKAQYQIQFGTMPVVRTDHVIQDPDETKIVVEQCSANDDAYDFCSFIIDNAETVSVFSDGVQSFEKSTEEDFENLPHLDIVQEYVGFKNKKGEFVKRRLKRMLQGHKKDSTTHYDDISIASINMS